MRFRLALLVAMIFTAAGCGPSATPVEGVIKINGKPAENLLIQLSPVKSTESKVVGASAVSDASGRFVLKCDNGRPGALPGTYKVIVFDNNLNVEDEPGQGKRPRLVNRVPLEYASASSPQELTVELGKKDYEINLTVRR